MKIFKLFLFTLFVFGGKHSLAQTEEPYSVYGVMDYVKDNPNCESHDVLYEGCTLNLNSNGDFLFGHFTILHPELQMRILMQGLTIYVDPTGKKKEKYALHFPAASKMEDIEQLIAPPTSLSENNEIPDISRLIDDLDKYGATFEINRRNQKYSKEWTSISLDTENFTLTYTFIIPVENLLNEKKIAENWKIGLFSEGGNSRNAGPGMGGPGMGGPGIGGPGIGGPGIGGPNENRISAMEEDTARKEKNEKAQDLRKIMMKDIEVWVPFSFEQILSLNNDNI